MMRTRLVALFGISVGLGALIAVGRGPKEAAQEVSLPVGTAAPDFVLQNREGQSVRLSDFRGQKSVALVFYPAQFRAGS
jgi:cytochrome oxidase Cu insertion factor (SCO1/SenC/PrrC family)